MKKVTIKDISDSLNISRITVWKVLNNKEGVSETTKQKIIKKAVELDYKKLDSDLVTKTLTDSKPNNNILVIVSRPDTTVFWVRIINQIANELKQKNLNLIFNPLTEEEEENFELPIIIKNNEVKGIIIINVYNEAAVKQLCSNTIPKIFLDIPISINPYDINADIVLLEGVRSIYNLTNIAINKGYTKLGFIGDITYAQTITDRWYGFLKALELNKLELNENWCLTKSIPHDLYKNVIKEFVFKLESMPQIFVCANDYISYILIEYLTELGLTIPNDIAVSGYDDNAEFTVDKTFLTTIKVKNEFIGKSLVRQLMYRIENIESDYETIYINPKIVLRKSV